MTEYGPPSYMHDRFVTPRYFVLHSRPAILDGEALQSGSVLRDAIDWRPSLPSRRRLPSQRPRRSRQRLRAQGAPQMSTAFPGGKHTSSIAAVRDKPSGTDASSSPTAMQHSTLAETTAEPAATESVATNSAAAKVEPSEVASSTATSSEAKLSTEQLRALQRRSNREGLLRLAGHVAAIGASGALYGALLERGAHAALVGVAAVGYGFTLVTMFAAMHESVHRTAFSSKGLNDLVGWFAGLLSFYNSTFYRYYHGWHHRFTQIPGRDPELDDPKPTSLGSYLKEMSGYYWWLGKLQTHGRIALGRVQNYPFLSEVTRPMVVRSVRLQLSTYALGITLSVAVGEPWFVTYWLLPVALGQPLLRFVLLAEHTGCSEDDNAFTNTRTTHTLLPVRFLMWEMPYHAEHHRYPALPFFALAPAHAVLGTAFAHVARHGYVGVHVDFLRSIGVTRGAQGLARRDPAGSADAAHPALATATASTTTVATAMASTTTLAIATPPAPSPPEPADTEPGATR